MGIRIQAVLDDKTLRRLKRYCKEENRTLSNAVFLFVTEALDKHDLSQQQSS